MTPQLTVGSVPDPRYAADLAPVVSLPESLRRASGESDLVGVRGEAGWPDAAAAAIRAGARGVLVVGPSAADTGALAELADERAVPVVLDSYWAGNPAVEQSRLPFAAVADARAVVEARVHLPLDSDLDHAALDLLALLRRSVGPVTRLRFLRRAPSGWVALADLATGATGTLDVIRTRSLPATAVVRVVTATDSVELTVPAPTTATPGRTVVSGADGSTLLETRYETAHRAAWRRLHTSVIQGLRAEDLREFAEDVRVLHGG